jgi:hypothetical protein
MKNKLDLVWNEVVFCDQNDYLLSEKEFLKIIQKLKLR